MNKKKFLSPDPPPDVNFQESASKTVTLQLQEDLVIMHMSVREFNMMRNRITTLESEDSIHKAELRIQKADLSDLGSYKTSAGYLRITCIGCSLLTAAGTYLAGTEKPVWFFPPEHNGTSGLVFVLASVAFGVFISIFGRASKNEKYSPSPTLVPPVPPAPREPSPPLD
ncbi:MAG: hypothetical protein LBT40_16705 [Deltaproteobacteria bacterium]|jgi:hypothetical protein|nr:hypothetical protein [Deltaproteobacteria bacterium]